MISFKEFVQNVAGQPQSVSYEDKKNGFSCLIKKMTAIERDQWEVKQTKRIGAHTRRGPKLSDDERFERYQFNIRARYLAEVIVDENRNRIFTDQEADRLGEISADIVVKIYDFAMEVNGFTESDMEEIEKN